ncbi:hypothetical protein BDZ91DRAFT_699484 [Kalaharituber pfeilii]|nr:hypothetical protein BDZ91DRAFT_699484 [Kalaharituber pfeilii]
MSSIQPLPDGRYDIYSSVRPSGRALYLHAFVPGTPIHYNDVGISVVSKTIWVLSYQPSRGAYWIWEEGKEKVLDVFQCIRGAVVSHPHHGGENQLWAIRRHFQPSGGGWTLTPLSDPHLALTLRKDARNKVINPAIVEPVPPNSAPEGRHLWIFTPTETPGTVGFGTKSGGKAFVLNTETLDGMATRMEKFPE